nr:unnamed protein product [Callosobruchus chinensis]
MDSDEREPRKRRRESTVESQESHQNPNTSTMNNPTTSVSTVNSSATMAYSAALTQHTYKHPNKEQAIVFPSVDGLKIQDYLLNLGPISYIDNIHISALPTILTNRNTIPPWTVNLPIVITELTKFSKHESPSTLIMQKFSQILNQYSSYTRIFTDASKPNGSVGTALVTPTVIIKNKLPDSATVLTGELYAILEALRYIREDHNENWIIIADSLNALTCLTSLYMKNPLRTFFPIIAANDAGLYMYKFIKLATCVQFIQKRTFGINFRRVRMVMCFVPDCKHYSERKTCCFFRFPKDPVVNRKWISLIRRGDKSPTPSFLVCSYHFVDRDRTRLPTLFKRNETKLFSYQSPERKKKATEFTTVTPSIEPRPSTSHAFEPSTSYDSKPSTSYDPKPSTSFDTSDLIIPTAERNDKECTDSIDADVPKNCTYDSPEAEIYFLRKENEEMKAKLQKRLTSFSFDEIKNDDKLVNMYTYSLFENIPLNYVQGWRVGKISKRDQFLLTLMKLRLNLLITAKKNQQTHQKQIIYP